MNHQISQFLLIASGAFAAMGAIGSLMGLCMKSPAWGQAASRLGLIGSGVCSSILTVLMLPHENSGTNIERVLLWTLFSIQSPGTLSLEFGLEATWFSAGLVGVVAGLFIAAPSIIGSQKKAPLSEDTMLASSLLYATTTGFLLSPNVAQSLLSWGASSVLVGILIRLSRDNPSARTAGTLPGSNINPLQRPDPPSARRTISLPMNSAAAEESCLLRLLSRGIHQISQQSDQIYKWFTRTVPGWIGEQSEAISDGPDSIKTLATISGLFAILLTWLLIS